MVGLGGLRRQARRHLRRPLAGTAIDWINMVTLKEDVSHR
jgi:hypothetical protein